MPNHAPQQSRTERTLRAGAPRRGTSHERASLRPPRRGPFASLTAGGSEGNERLTVLTGFLLIVLLAGLGITILRIGQLLWLHLFLGLLLLGPLALKLSSTGYRFLRYYTRNPPYRVKGPPAPGLRLMAPLLVLDTLAVFGSGVAMLLIGPSSRQPLLLVHKATFILWLLLTALHVLGHLPEILRMLRIAGNSRSEMIAMRTRGPRPARAGAAVDPAEHLAGGAGRWLSMASALVVGLVLAIALIPQFGAWTNAVFAFGHFGH